jgi:tRNA modification GTPase
MHEDDTIAAICTGAGGSISVIRLSGPRALELAAKVWRGRQSMRDATPRTLHLGQLVDDENVTIDHCMAVAMPAPGSYTGEDVVEFQCHGGASVARAALAALLAAGARAAEGGEFTRRAFINGKIDLTQAEAVLDVIQAQSSRALAAANKQLAGSLRRRLDSLYDRLTETLAEIEVRLDFSDEDLDWQSTAEVANVLDETAAVVNDLLSHQREGEILRHGVRTVIAGQPNAGKSSLLNLVLGHERAIVTEIPGTTRDTVEECIQLRGIPLHLIDTAGLRQSDDIVERQGIERSRMSIKQADLVLWVIDATENIPSQLPDPALTDNSEVLLILNKVDLARRDDLTVPNAIELSALTGDGFDGLLDAIEERVWAGCAHSDTPDLVINARHAEHLRQAADRVAEAQGLVDTEQFEVLAISVRSTLDEIGAITGRTLSDDVLDSIFSRFCIGK